VMNEVATHAPEANPASAKAEQNCPTTDSVSDAAQKETMTGAQIIVRSLIAQKVDVVFGYPGGQVLDLYDELYLHSKHIQHVITAHEQGAVHAADGFARATGKTGVVIATSGPGATNLVTGIATAQLDSIPLVAITGNVATTLLGKDSFQETDIFGITIPVTKHNYIVKNVEDLPGVLAEAFEVAQSGRPGPVLVDVPRDVQKALFSCNLDWQGENDQKVENALQVKGSISFSSGEISSFKKAAELIASSKRPLIYCGGGTLAAAAQQHVIDFADHIDAAIGCTIMGLTAIPASHPRNLGMTGMHGRELAIRAVDSADLIIAIGARFSDRATGNKEHFTQGKSFIHIDIDPAEIDKNILVDVALVGDMNATLNYLLAQLPGKQNAAWQKEIAEMRNSFCGAGTSRHASFSAKNIIKAVQERTDAETIIATDVGQHQMWVAQNYQFEKPRTFLTSGGLGTMGFGMGAAMGGCIGKSLATNSAPKKTVLFTGDGSFGMNLNEMATAVSQNLPLVIIVMNNGVLGMVRQWQSLFYDERYSQTTLSRATDFPALAQAFGANGCKAHTLSELNVALDEAFSAQGPYLIDCVINEDDRVLPMIPPGGTINDMLVDEEEKGENCG